MRRRFAGVVLLSIACGGGSPPPVAPVAPVAPPPRSPAAPTIVLNSAATGIGSGQQAWDGTQPFECSGLDSVLLKDIKLTVAHDPAITATGLCKLRLDNVDVTAPTVVYATGMSDVIIIGGALHGTKAAIYATGEGKVHVQGGTVIDGPVEKSGVGVVDGI